MFLSFFRWVWGWATLRNSEVFSRNARSEDLGLSPVAWFAIARRMLDNLGEGLQGLLPSRRCLGVSQGFDASRQKLTPRCLAAIFDSPLPSPNCLIECLSNCLFPTFLRTFFPLSRLLRALWAERQVENYRSLSWHFWRHFWRLLTFRWRL